MTATAIRRANAADGPTLYRAWLAMRQHNASHDPRIVLAPVSESEFCAGLYESLSRPGATTFVAESNGVVQGFVSASVVANTPDRLPDRHVSIGYIYVDQRYRRGGVARSLVEAVRGWAGHQEGVQHLEMPVVAADIEASAFWRAVGFSPFIERLWAPLEVDAGDEGEAAQPA
jgi:GNAT superfamily N-acetyltransferase